MKRLITISIVLLLVLGITISVIPLFLPDRTDIQYQAEVELPKSTIYEAFNNLKTQTNYYAFLKQDSMVSKRFFDPYVGKNANFKWYSFEENVGSGEMLITESTEDSIINMVFMNEKKESFEDHFQFDSLDIQKTRITWNRKGVPVSYFNRYTLWWQKELQEKEVYQSFLNAQRQLADIKAPIIKIAKPGAISKEHFEGGKFLVAEEELDIEKRKLQYSYTSKVKNLHHYLSKNLKVNERYLSSPITIIKKWDTIHAKSILDFGYSIDTAIERTSENYSWRSIPASEVYTFVHKGSINDIDSIRAALFKVIKKENAIPTHHFWLEELESNSNHDTVIFKAYQSIRM